MDKIFDITPLRGHKLAEFSFTYGDKQDSLDRYIYNIHYLLMLPTFFALYISCSICESIPKFSKQNKYGQIVRVTPAMYDNYDDIKTLLKPVLIRLKENVGVKVNSIKLRWPINSKHKRELTFEIEANQGLNELKLFFVDDYYIK